MAGTTQISKRIRSRSRDFWAMISLNSCEPRCLCGDPDHQREKTGKTHAGPAGTSKFYDVANDHQAQFTPSGQPGEVDGRRPTGNSEPISKGCTWGWYPTSTITKRKLTHTQRRMPKCMCGSEPLPKKPGYGGTTALADPLSCGPDTGSRPLGDIGRRRFEMKSGQGEAADGRPRAELGMESSLNGDGWRRRSRWRLNRSGVTGGGRNLALRRPVRGDWDEERTTTSYPVVLLDRYSPADPSAS